MASNNFIPMLRNQNGKRERMNQEDDPDVLPLSKRMNNIHFDGGVQTMQSHNSCSQSHGPSHNGVQNGFSHGHLPHQSFSNSHTSSIGAVGIGNGVLQDNEGHLQNYSNGIGDGQGGFSHPANGMNGYNSADLHTGNGNFEERLIDGNGQVTPLNKIQYSPTLNQESNPFYYEQNRMLFELYKERLERHNLPPHSNYGSG